jgi:hypothetical protein
VHANTFFWLVKGRTFPAGVFIQFWMFSQKSVPFHRKPLRAHALNDPALGQPTFYRQIFDHQKLGKVADLLLSKAHNSLGYLKGSSHQIWTASKWHDWIDIGRDMRHWTLKNV